MLLMGTEVSKLVTNPDIHKEHIQQHLFFWVHEDNLTSSSLGLLYGNTDTLHVGFLSYKGRSTSRQLPITHSPDPLFPVTSHKYKSPGHWRDESTVKSIFCTSRRPRYDSQPLHGSSQPSITWNLRSMIHSSGLRRQQACMWYTCRHTHRQQPCMW